jgi:hypothetical protein
MSDFLEIEWAVTAPVDVHKVVADPAVGRPATLIQDDIPTLIKSPQVKTYLPLLKTFTREKGIMSTPSQMRAARIVEVYSPIRLHLILKR